MQPRGINPSGTARATVAQAGAAASNADWRSTLARFGLVAKGVLYVALGVLASNVASGEAASDAATKRGAIELVASQPFGQWLLAILTFGLFALALWQFILAATGDPVEGSEAKDRAKFTVKAFIYLGTAFTALSLLMPHWGGAGASASAAGDSSQQQATATVMSWPGGPWIVAIAGLAIAAFAIQQAYRHGWKRAFMQRLDRYTMGSEMTSGVERAGRAGYTARAIVLLITGGFLVAAAVQHDPQEAVGLSGALRTIAEQTWGQAMLWLVAIGLFLYGCFCFAEARYRRAT